MIRIQYFIILGIALACFSSARANENSQGGMHYLYIKKEEEPQTSEQKTEQEKETPETKVWNKYKALAAGTPEPEEKKPEDTAEKEDALPNIESKEPAAEKPAKPTGMAAIIEEYRASRTQRSQMHTLTVAPEPEQKTDEQSSK